MEVMTDKQLREIEGAIMGRTKKIVDETPAINEMMYFTTGCTLLDLAFGGSKGALGIVSGDIINIPGAPSSGKTLLAMDMIAANKYKYKDKFRFVFDDAESGNTFDMASRYGFSLDEGESIQSTTVEEWSCNVRKFVRSLKSDEVGLYILDSLDGLGNDELLERVEKRQKAFEAGREFDDGTYGMQSPKFLSTEFFRTLTAEINKKNILIVILSQVRDNVGAGLYGAKYVRSGGRALDHGCHTIAWLKTLEKTEVKNRMIGASVQCKITKSKTPRPNRVCVFSYFTEYGIDNIGSNIDFLYDIRSDKTGELTKGAGALKWDEEELSRDNLIKYIETNHLQAELEKRVIDKWEAIEDSIKVERASKYDV